MNNPNLREGEFYIGQNVFARIDGQIVRLRKHDSNDGIYFDTGGIDILYREMKSRTDTGGMNVRRYEAGR